MPYTRPTEAMLAFAEQFGDLIVVEDQEEGSVNPLAQPAFGVAADILSAFVGGKNQKGDTFSFDIQVVENYRPTALCSTLGGQCNILIFSGLLGRIVEIAALVSNLFAEGWDRRVDETVEGKAIGIQYLFDLIEKEQSETIEAMEGIIKNQQESGRIAFFYYITNYLLIFVIMHEARHGVEGHAFYISETDEGIYLGESPTDALPEGSAEVQKFLELEADSDAIFQLLIDFLRGREYFSISNLEIMAMMAGHDVEIGETARLDRLTGLWLSILLLANSWRYSSLFSARSDTHPMFIDRLVNLFWCPVRLEMEAVEGSELLGSAYNELGRAIGHLSSESKQFLPLAVNLVQGGVDRYFEMATKNGKEFSAIKAKVEPFAFRPPGQISDEDFGIMLHADRERK